MAYSSALLEERDVNDRLSNEDASSYDKLKEDRVRVSQEISLFRPEKIVTFIQFSRRQSNC